jgi:hypothetical protein
VLAAAPPPVAHGTPRPFCALRFGAVSIQVKRKMLVSQLIIPDASHVTPVPATGPENCETCPASLGGAGAQLARAPTAFPNLLRTFVADRPPVLKEKVP